MNKIEIELLNTEQKIAEYIARSRTKTNRAAGIKNLKAGPQSSEETELEGVASELAAAKILNVWPDLDTSKASVEDFTFRGYTIDVKTTKYHAGRLLLPLYKKDKACDYYILMIGSFPKYKCMGFAAKKDLINEDKIGTLGNYKNYMLEQNELKTLEEFLNETKARA